nr:uncharacterized protein LOC109164935 [Ipomoea batatas]
MADASSKHSGFTCGGSSDSDEESPVDEGASPANLCGLKKFWEKRRNHLPLAKAKKRKKKRVVKRKRSLEEERMMPLRKEAVPVDSEDSDTLLGNPRKREEGPWLLDLTIVWRLIKNDPETVYGCCLWHFIDFSFPDHCPQNAWNKEPRYSQGGQVSHPRTIRKKGGKNKLKQSVTEVSKRRQLLNVKDWLFIHSGELFRVYC